MEAHAIINALSPFCTSADGRRTIAPSHGEREGRGCGVRLSLNHIDQGGQQNLLSQPRPRSAFPPLRTPTQHRHPATHDTRPSPHRTPFLTTQVPPGPASWKPGSPRPHQTLYHGSPPSSTHEPYDRHTTATTADSYRINGIETCPEPDERLKHLQIQLGSARDHYCVITVLHQRRRAKDDRTIAWRERRTGVRCEALIKPDQGGQRNLLSPGPRR